MGVQMGKLGTILATLLLRVSLQGWAQSGAEVAQGPARFPVRHRDSRRVQERPISWKLIVPKILVDRKPNRTFPGRVAKEEHWTPTFAIAGATASLVVVYCQS